MNYGQSEITPVNTDTAHSIARTAAPFPPDAVSEKLCAFYTHKEIAGWRYGLIHTAAAAEALAGELGISSDRMIAGKQIHSTYIHRVYETDGGAGILRPNDWEGDGLITNCRRLLLCTREADCLPVFFYDPVKEAIGMIHSGWRGTAACISAEAVRRMGEEFGSRPENILAAFGPCICKDCYEVGGELIPAFEEHFDGQSTVLLFTPKENGKFLLNLQGAAAFSLEKAGVLPEHIYYNSECTYHSGRYDSYRLTHSLDYEMLTGIMLR